MRCASVRRGSTAAVIGAVLFSVTASATTLTPLSSFNSATGLTTFGVRVEGNSPTGLVTFWVILPGKKDPLELVPVSDGAALFTHVLSPGAHAVTAYYRGDATNQAAVLEFTVVVPVVWLPPVLDGLLSN